VDDIAGQLENLIGGILWEASWQAQDTLLKLSLLSWNKFHQGKTA
jgi:hypothetical protein